MCGIVGIASKSPVANRSWIATARDAMTHRGPDDFGEWWSDDGRVGLGHRRLSIIDLSIAGHQPMADSDGECHVVFNGEIYNFREIRLSLERKGHSFISNSDTEVIVAAYREWGPECLSRLSGMFSFALFDSKKDKVFLARDRAGEKPLYYSTANGVLRFSSELKGLMADPSFDRRINSAALDCYLAIGFIPGELCILDGVRKLPPAHAMQFDLREGSARTWRYWGIPDAKSHDGQNLDSEERLVLELESTLQDAVRQQLVADVPVGILLSGGIDSSLITALAVRARPKIKTFTVRFPGFDEFDETEHAKLIATRFATEHIELEATESAVDLMPMLARQYDEPMADSSMVPTYMISRLVREHCTVALGGDGGDELFGGYSKYNRYLGMQRRLARIPQFIRTAAAGISASLLPIGFRGRNWMQQLACDFDCSVPFDGAHFDHIARGSLSRSAASLELIAEELWTSRMPCEHDVVQRATRMDFENYLPEKILVKVDRASMINSLEVRAPFLDQRLIEFAFADVPTSLKVSETNRKILLKKLARRILPAEFDAERKQGFSIPLASWLKSGPWREFFREVLTDGSTSTFNAKTINRLLAGQARGYTNSERLFSLVLFELWRKEYGV